MKKTIYSILAAAGVIFASGCSKDINPVENKVAGEITLTASLPGDLTKAAVDGTDNTKVNWSEGDAVSVWGGENNKFTLSSEAGTPSGYFSGTVKSGTAQYAMSPYSATATIDAGVITTNVPNTQTAPAGSFDPAASIIVGTISGSAITFHHALAYLKITAPNDVTNLIEITIESNGGIQLTGDAKFTAADGAFTATGTPCKYVTIKSSTGTFTSGGIYYAAVIPGNYTGGLTVKYIYKDDSNHKLIGKSKCNSTALTLSAGTAKLLSAATTFDKENYDVAIQLWSGGPYWATTNIGADASTDYGQYFAWGYPAGQTPFQSGGWKFSRAFNNDNYPYLYMDRLDATHDMAIVNWGTSWSVPTNTDLGNLISSSNTAIEYVKSESAHWSTYSIKGILVTGKTSGYTSNSIFLPAAGYGNGNFLNYAGGSGYYLSSVGYGSKNPYYLYFNPEEQISDVKYNIEKHYGSSVRPVRSSL